MSWDGVTIGFPSFGPKILFEPSINWRASWIASSPNGTWTAIWSPSKSALNAGVTSGCRRIARPSTSFGSNTWIPNLCNVGARLSNTGCCWITSSTIGQIRSSILSINLSAALIFVANWSLTRPLITNGLNRFNAISRGIPHWYIFKSGPTAITERPE